MLLRLLATATFILALPTYAQKANYVISGTLCDSVSHQPEAYATVRLLTTHDQAKVLRVATTTVKGAFTIVAPHAGRFTFEAIVLGKQPVRREVELSSEQPSLSLDTLYIKEYTSSLAQATITATKPLVQAEIDKITYSMADDPDAQTSTTLEMLRKVPMVTVDGEDNIKVNGNSSFKVYVNGKPNQMMSQNPSTIFKSYPASAIKKIEVITNPGAKYDADGVAGVLNIITNEETSTSGYSLTPNLSFSNRGVNGNLFALAQFGKFTFSVNYGIGKHKSPENISTVSREMFADDVNHLFDYYSKIKSEGLFQYGNFDASYEFSEKDLLSASVGLWGYNGSYDPLSQSKMLTDDGALSYSYDLEGHNKNKFTNLSASLDFQHTFKENQHLTFSYRFNYAPAVNKSERIYSNMVSVPESLDLLDQKTDPDNLSAEHTLQADFTTPIAEAHTLSTGVKYIFRINRSNSTELTRTAGTNDAFQINDDRSLRYRHRGDIGAAYAEYNFKKNKWALMAGSRYEYYHVKVTYPDGKRSAFSTDMSDWVPSVSLGYNISDAKMLKVGYNLRIGRPDISCLSPYRDRSTPESVSYGNPDLGSTKSHNLNLTFSTFSSKFTLNASLTYAFSNNELTDYTFVDQGVVNTTYGDFLHSKSTVLSTFINWTIFEGTVLNLNLYGNYSDYKSKPTNEHNSGFSVFASGGLRQNLWWKLKLGLWAGGSTRGVNLQGKGSSFFFYNLRLSRSFLKDDRLTLSLSAGNFLGRYRHFRSETTTAQYHSLSDIRNDALRLSFGVSMRIGSLKTSVKKVARSIENDDKVSAPSNTQSSSEE